MGRPPVTGPHGTTNRRTLRWQNARVLAVRDETPRARTLPARAARPRPHLAGQHYVVRLTAPDGYTASRSYSVASAPDETGEIELTVEKLDDGEVSGFLHDVVEPGDELEVRGPIGGFFVWTGDTPALLVGGGSGVVPLMAMLRHARRLGRSDLVRLVVSARSPDDLYYADELPGPETVALYTREAPPGARPGGGPASPPPTSRRWCAAARTSTCAARPVRRRRHRVLLAAGRAHGPYPGRALRPVRLTSRTTPSSENGSRSATDRVPRRQGGAMTRQSLVAAALAGAAAGAIVLGTAAATADPPSANRGWEAAANRGWDSDRPAALAPPER